MGAVVVTVVMLWSFVYLPINRKLDDQVVIRDRIQTQLIEMQSFEQLANTQQISKRTLPQNLTFSTWVDQQLNQLGMQELVNRTEPIDTRTLTLWLNNAPFDQVIDWLQTIHDIYGIRVDQIDVNVTDRSLGYTNIRMRLISP